MKINGIHHKKSVGRPNLHIPFGGMVGFTVDKMQKPKKFSKTNAFLKKSANQLVDGQDPIMIALIMIGYC